jgi:hypothetical protein
VVPSVQNDNVALVVKGRQSKKNGLLTVEDDGTMIFASIRNRPTAQRHIPENLHSQYCMALRLVIKWRLCMLHGLFMQIVVQLIIG